MNNRISLRQVVKYTTERISVSHISKDSYIGVDNLLPNKSGVKIADKLPLQGGSVPKYKRGDILIGNIRPYLKKIWLSNKCGGASADVLVLNVDPKYDSRFVYYSIIGDEFFDHIMRGSKGTRMPRGDKNQILDFSIPDFNIRDQQKIADILSALDAKIELNNRINTELEAMAKTLYDYWFVQFDFPYNFKTGKPDPAGKPYKSSDGKMVWSEELKREIPEGWEVTELKNILKKEIKSKKIASSDILPTGSIPVIDQSTEFIAGYTNNQDSLIRSEGPVIVFGDHTRIIKLVDFDFARGADGTQLILSKDQRIPEYVLYYYLKEIDLSNYGYARHFKFLKDQIVLLPDIEVSKLLCIIMKSIHGIINNNIFSNINLSNIRDWLLPMLMNGQISKYLRSI